MRALLLIFAIAFFLSLIPGLWVLLRSYLKLRGTYVITCPETNAPAAVELDAAQAAATSAFGQGDFRLKSCTRWPERRDCGRECLAQIESAPEECLVRTILTKWYEGSTCALCGKVIGAISWAEHKPALISPDRRTFEWDEIRAEELPKILETHRQICWDCHVAESFRSRFPDRVVDDPRPARRANSHSNFPGLM